ncbi:MAG: hypothetical protein M3P37_00180 [Actinomycetota bacterium]|nr:hypothetical protein [Actinomycetota bacterium]
MTHEDESRAGVCQALADLGWEVRAEGGRPNVVVGGYGKYHVMVSFGDGEPTSLIISYVGSGEEMLSRKWPGVERLPTPQKVVRALPRSG